MRTFGRIVLEERELGWRRSKMKRRAWVIRCEPHVALRLKRLFHRIDKGQFGDLLLLDTPEVCRELDWFLLRYPMEMDDEYRLYLEEQAGEHEGGEQDVFEMLAGHRPPAEFELAVPLREYQRIAVELALRTGSLLLADDVGLGKSAAAIGMFTDPRTLPALVVTLTHLPRQWKGEIAKFAPHLKVHIARKGNPAEMARCRCGAHDPFPDVIVLNYHKLHGWADTLAGQVRSVIFDEAQELRRPDSDKYQAAAHVAERAEFRKGLSATPIFNYGGEMFHVLDVLRPDCLGTYDEFTREWCNHGRPGRAPSVRDPRAFGAFLRDAGLMLRRTRAEVGRELPALTKVPQTVDVDLEAIDKVEDAAAELARIILTRTGLARGEKLRASEELSWMLRQATGIAKARAVAEFVRILVENGERVVLYGWHREVYSIWEARLRDLKPEFYTGSESVGQKQTAFDRFQAKETPLLIMSLRSGAGVDGLQATCRTVVFGELDWSPAVLEQCIGRVLRDGQTDPVFAYFLLSDSGSDPVIADILGLKVQQIEALRDPDLELIEELQIDEDHVRRLAKQFLSQRGLPAQEAVVA